MTAKPTIDLVYCFHYSHYETDGKLENIYDCLDHIDELDHICLDLTDGPLDNLPLELAEIEHRTDCAIIAIASLRKRGYTTDLIIPGLLAGLPTDPNHRNLLSHLTAQACQSGAATIWLDDRPALVSEPTEILHCPAACRAFATASRISITPKRLLAILTTDDAQKNLTATQQKIKTAWFRFLHSSLLQACHAARKSIPSQSRRLRLGLIAAPATYYQPFGITPAELATELNPDAAPLLAQYQSFTDDYRRTAVLDTTQQISPALPQRANTRPLGFIHHRHASSFHKSIEATQMQINLNLLHGVRTIMLDTFDEFGSAPGSENPYVQMFTNTETFWNRLVAELPSHSTPAGLTVITPDVPPDRISPPSADLADYCQSNPWPTILGRLGFPVRHQAPSAVDPDSNLDTIYIIAGDTPLALTRKQLDHVFAHGVLLDVKAAETIQRMNHSALLGLTVHGPLPNIQAEILSDAAFMHSHHGHRSLLKGVLAPTDLRRLEPVHPNTRTVSTLLPLDGLPNIPGIVLFDNTDKSHRSATLPYTFAHAPYDHLLDTPRQLHLHNILIWLLRRRLPCFVENAPDLVPFYIPTSRRIILALLNVGFDWAIDSRVRFGKLPFALRRIREINDQGKLINHPDLKIVKLRDYQYLQLNSDTAVPPMQMTTFILEP